MQKSQVFRAPAPLGCPGLKTVQRDRQQGSRSVRASGDSHYDTASHRATTSAPATREYQKGLIIPNMLRQVSSQGGQNTIYTVRLSTSYKRGSALDESAAGVELCMVNSEGEAILQRISPCNDPAETRTRLQEIEKAFDKDLGANSKALSAALTQVSAPSEVQRRFQAGGIDEISFLGPELGPIKSILIGPERGTWHLEELTIASSRTRHSDRFVCRELLGKGRPAAFLSSIPAEMIVYGSGEAATVLTKAQARRLQEEGMARYTEMKQNIFMLNSALVFLGTGTTWEFVSRDSALPFLVGGVGGLLYMFLLQKNVDSMATTRSSKDNPTGLSGTLSRLAGSYGLRVAIVAGLAFLCSSSILDANDKQRVMQVQPLLFGTSGFLMYKLAAICVSAFPPQEGHPKSSV